MCRVFLVLAAVCALAYGARVRLDRGLAGRIVGGHDTNIEELPYQLSLEKYGSHVCGAAIISADWAITAAQCLGSVSPHRVYLRAGSSTLGSGGTLHQAADIIIHPDYSLGPIDYTYALIKVATPFPIGQDNVQPIPLADSEPAGGAAAVTSGWGAASNGGSFFTQLQSVEVPIVSRHDCRESYRGRYDITDRMICAGWLGVGGKDACKGDTGGPLASGGRLVGIVSFGTGCARPDLPKIYMSVADQRAWIKEETGV